MAAQNQNQSFRLLEDHVTELGTGPDSPSLPPGRYQGAKVALLEETIHDAGTKPVAPLDNAMRDAARRIAALLATAPDPAATAEQFQKLLLAELAGRQP